MKTLKKTLALIAALTVVATSFAGCKKDENKPADSTTKAPETTKAPGEPGDPDTTDAPPVETPAGQSAERPDDDAVTVGKGGAQFTVVAWNPNDFPALLNAYTGNWAGVTPDAKTALDTLAANKKTPTGVDINFKNLGITSQAAQTTYDQMLDGGEDIDVYAAEADFALKYTGDNVRSTDLTKLGFKESDWANAYSYTLEIAKNAAGEVRGASWQACPGGYAYRADLAKDYLGVDTPEAMQPLVSSWEKMEETAAIVADKSGGKCAMVDSTGAIWQVFSANRSSAWVVDDTLVVDDQSLLDYIDLVKRWADKGYVSKIPQWHETNWKPQGTNDTVLGFFVSTWGFGDSILLGAAGGAGGKDKDGKDVAPGKTFGQWKVVQGPAQFYWGGTWMVVNSKTDNGIEAKDFIWALTIDNETMKQYGIAKGEYVNNRAVIGEVAKDPSVTTNDVTKNLGGQNFYEVLSDAAAGIKLNASDITKFDATVKQQFQDSVGDYVNGVTKDTNSTMEAFKKRVSKNVSGVIVPD